MIFIEVINILIQLYKEMWNCYYFTYWNQLRLGYRLQHLRVVSRSNRTWHPRIVRRGCLPLLIRRNCRGRRYERRRVPAKRYSCISVLRRRRKSSRWVKGGVVPDEVKDVVVDKLMNWINNNILLCVVCI